MLNKCIRRYFFYLSPRPPLEKKNAWSQVNRWQVISVWMSNAMVNKTTLICRILKEHKFTAAVRKWEMLAATKEKMSGSEKVKQEHVRHFLHITCNQEVSWRLTLQSCKTTAKKCAKKKKCAARAKLFFFFLLDLLLFFQSSRCIRPLALHDFIFSLSKL